MTSNTVFSVLKQIADTPSKNEKLSIIESVRGSDVESLFKKVVEYAYSPYKMYNIKKFKSQSSHSGTSTLEECFRVLDALVERSVTGNAAIIFVEKTLSRLSEEEASVFERIVKKDLRCGASESSFNKVWPGLVYEHPYMRCSSLNEKTVKKLKLPYISEVKSDGRYVDIIARPDSVTYMSRAGHVVDFNHPDRDIALMAEAQVEGAFVLMGETLVSDGVGGVLPRAEGNGYLNNDDIDKSILRFVVWDLVSLRDFESKFCPITRIDRIDNVVELVANLQMSGVHDISVVEYRICNTNQEAINHFEEVVKAGGEGVVLKNFKGVWKDGTSADQIKLKIIVEGELLVVGMTEGEGRLKGMCGALICQSSCGLVAVNVAGLSDKLRKEFFDNPDSIVGSVITLKYNDVVYSETTGLWSLYLPRFVEKRTDKFEADDREKLIEQLKSAIDGIKLF